MLLAKQYHLPQLMYKPHLRVIYPLPQQNITNPNNNISSINPGNSVLSNNNALNDTLATVLEGQQEWQDHAINVMSSLATKQDDTLALEAVPVFTGKDRTIKIEDWIRAVEKAALLTDLSKKRIALQKIRGTPSRYIENQIDASWAVIKKNTRELVCMLHPTYKQILQFG